MSILTFAPALPAAERPSFFRRVGAWFLNALHRTDDVFAGGL